MCEAIYFRASLPQMQICVQTANAYVLDSLVPVIVYAVGLLAAAGADMRSPWHFQLYVKAVFIFIDIFYDYIFQSKQFCCIIFHRAYRSPFDGVSAASS